MSDIDAIRARASAARRRAEAGKQSPVQEPPTLQEEPQSRNWGAATAEQFGAGSQTGIANALGFPVDALAGGISGLGEMTGMWGPIDDPVGGSASIDRLMQPLRADVPKPQGRGQRMSRRIGEEVGASAAMAPLGFANAAVRAAPGVFAGTEAASALGSGTGAAVAKEAFPDSATAEIVGALAGGIPAGYFANRALGGGRAAPEVRGGIEDQRMIADDAYSQVRADQRVLPQDSVQGLSDDISGMMASERVNPVLQPGSTGVASHIADSAAMPNRIEDIENLRRITEAGIPVTAPNADKRIAGMIKGKVTDYLDSLNDPVSDALVDGRDAHRRASAAQSISDASTKAARRAASTGSGGNEINAMRQNLRRILDNPRLSRSFKPDELKMMDQVVRGTASQNVMRRFSRFAPSGGGLSAMLGIGGAMASPAIALPIMAATEVAKHSGETSTRKVIEALMQSIAPDKVLSAGDAGMAPVIQALLAGRTTASATQDDKRTK